MKSTRRVVLTRAECGLAARVGCARQISALLMGLNDKHGMKNLDPWQMHIEGAAGELVVCKAMNWYWNASVDTFKHGHDAGVIQVRTRSRQDYDLIIRDDDNMLDVFVLVTGSMPTYEVQGWIRAGDARRDEWRQSYGGREPAWFVPKVDLLSIEQLAGAC